MAKPKIIYPNKINVRVEKDTKDWYDNQSKVRGFTLSGFIRHIPNIVRLLEIALDDKDNEIIDLKEKLNVKKK